MDCVKKIGCFPSCNAIRFPYKALETGVHLLVYEWLGSKKSIVFEAVAGEYFYIPNNFNESSDPVFSIKQPSGTFLCWDSDLEQLVSCPSSLGTNCDYIMNFTLEVVPTTGVPDEPAYSDKIYNISSAFDNGDGTYTISVLNPKDGDMAVDDNGTFYEYQGGVWTVKFKEVCAFQDEDNLPAVGEECALYFQGGKYWKWDGSQYVDVTPTIDFDDIDGLPNLVQSVNAGTGIDVDNTDPENPVVSLNQASQDSLDLADSAVQPGDNVSILNNDAGYLTETTHDGLPQDNPHGVTASQVGLGNVDNTSDADKPVSTAQGLAINQAEANAKQYTDDEINALNLGSASQADVGDFIATTEKGAANGVATLDGGGKVPAGQLPSSVMTLEGQWDASTNTPTLSDGTGDPGMVYEVTTPGTQDLGSGNLSFNVGDFVVYGNDGKWYRSINSNEVVEVNSKKGVVVLDPDDLDDSTTTHKFVSQSEKNAIGTAVQSVNGKTGNNVTIDPDDLDDSSTSHKFVSQSEKDDIASAIQPGDNVFELDTQFQTLTDAPVITWDVSQGEIAKVILGGNRTLANPSNLKAGRYDLIVEQDGVGGRTLLLENSYKLAGGPQPTLSSGAGEIDTFTGFSDGTSIYFHLNKAHESYVPQGFVITVDTTKTGTSTNTQFTIPTTGSGYNYSVKNALTGTNYLTGQTGGATVDFGTPGVYDIEIVGAFPRIFFNNTGDKDKLIEVIQWGNIVWSNLSRSFYGCSNLVKVSGTPLMSGVTEMHIMFHTCSSLVSVDTSGWDTSNVTRMNQMFYMCSSLSSLDVSAWDVSNVWDMGLAFYTCSSLLSLDVSNWNTSSATNMPQVFYNCTSLLDLPVQNWNIELVTGVSGFAGLMTIPTATYDQILNNWAAQSVQPNLNIDFGNSKYSPAGQVGRDILINTHGWVLTDGGPV